MALTKLEVRKAKTSDKLYKLADGGGLHLSVTPSGGKLWRWKYRFEGAEKLMSLGKYPDVSLAMARERHTESRRLLAVGTDPMGKRKEDKTIERSQAEGSFQVISQLWLEHWQEGKSPRHVASTKRRMEMGHSAVAWVAPGGRDRSTRTGGDD